eukprot:s3990_g3.t1
MDEMDFASLQAKVLGAESKQMMLQGRTGAPPPGWSPARAAALWAGDRAAIPGSGAGRAGGGGAGGGERFSDCNGRLTYLLDRLEARLLRAGPAPKKAAKALPPVLHLYDMEEPVEMAENDTAEQEGGSMVPFRLTEAKLSRGTVGDEPYFGRITSQVDTVVTNTVAIFSAYDAAGK